MSFKRLTNDFSDLSRKMYLLSGFREATKISTFFATRAQLVRYHHQPVRLQVGLVNQNLQLGITRHLVNTVYSRAEGSRSSVTRWRCFTSRNFSIISLCELNPYLACATKRETRSSTGTTPGIGTCHNSPSSSRVVDPCPNRQEEANCAVTHSPKTRYLSCLWLVSSDS